MKRTRQLYMRIMTSCVVSITGLGIAFVSAYFEHKYFCTIENTSITVSIQEGDTLCFGYLASMEKTIAELDSSIIRAENFVNLGSQDDSNYRRGVVANLNKQKQEWSSLRDRLVVAVDDYEVDLFLRIKGLVAYYLKLERETIAEKIGQANTLLIRLKLIGDETKFVFVLQNLDGLQHRMSLLDRIKFSQNFSELIPALKEYLQLPRIKNDNVT